MPYSRKWILSIGYFIPEKIVAVYAGNNSGNGELYNELFAFKFSETVKQQNCCDNTTKPVNMIKYVWPKFFDKGFSDL